MTSLHDVFNAAFDADDLSLVAMDPALRALHQGMVFMASYKSPDGAQIADDGTIELLITTTTKRLFIVFGYASGGDAEGGLYEGVTATGGTTVNVIAKNRSSVSASTVTVKHTPSVSDTGTLLECCWCPGGSGPHSGGGAGPQAVREDFILAANTVYLLRFINRAGSAKDMSLSAEWCEVE